MNDTAINIQNHFSEKIMLKNGIERLKMSASMYEIAQKLALASFPKNISKRERKILLFKRFYGNDFHADEIEKICREF